MRFTAMEPGEVLLGKARITWAERAPYRTALSAMDAGRVETRGDEEIGKVYQRLRTAAGDLGISIATHMESQRSFIWKKVARRRDRKPVDLATRRAQSA
jgi:hypothetical protein